MPDITFTAHVFKEDDMYVAYVRELDVSSCGRTAEEARKNIQDAVRGFLKEAEQMGTLFEILQEGGYRKDGETWQAPEFISLDRLTLTFQ